MRCRTAPIHRTLSIAIGLFAVARFVALPTLARADDDDGFYRGKQITLVVGTTTNGSYDLYARAFALFFGKHIPGEPKIIVENMPGASGLKAADYVANSAVRDGTVIALTLNNTPTGPLLEPSGANFDAAKLSWIGSITHDRYVGYVWHTAAAQSLEDLKTKEVAMGAEAIGSAGADIAVVGKEFFGLKIKLVLGYPDSGSVKLARERGELQGTFANAVGDLKSTRPAWLEQKLVRIIVQHGLEKSPDLPGVPSLMDLAQTDSDREALRLLLARQDFSKPFFAPPGIPATRLAILRRAFDETVVDPGFLDAAKTAQLPVDGPMTGQQLADVIAQVSATPPAVVQRILDTFAHYK
jgi:tripartite-type tricarboxylate transporter receptor subunit TctC